MKVLIEYGFQLFIPIMVGILSSLITYLLARRQFITERWWEKKAEAYSKIVEAMWHLLNYHHKSYGDITGEVDIPKERKDELFKHWRVGMDEVERVATIGRFIISTEATACLKDYLIEPDINYRAGELDVEIGDNMVRTQKYLDSIIDLARKDLNIKK